MPNFVQQAPQMMQQLAPDLAAQQVALQRQQQMADLIRQQGMAAPDRTEMVSGVAVKQSPLIGLSKMLQVYMGGKMQEAADSKGLELGKALQARQSDEYDRMIGGGGQSTPQQPPQPIQSTGGDPEQPGPALTPPQQQAPVDERLAGLRAQAKAALLMGNKDLANKLIENMSTMTEAGRRDRELGISSGDAAAYERAAREKASMYEMQPGSTTKNLRTGEERFAPKVGEGITLNNGQASAVPGYAESNAGIVGAAEAAKAGAGAQYDFVNVTNPDGTQRMMTKAQAAQQAGAPVASQPQNGIDFTASNGVKLNFSKTPFGQVVEQAMKTGDPDLIQAAQEYMSKGAKPKQAGIEMQSEAAKAAQVEQAKAGVDLEKSRLAAAQSPEAQQKILDAQGVVDLSASARKILEAGKATGSTAGTIRDKITGAVGVSTAQSQASAQLKAIGGALTAKQPKMSGPQSDKDVEQYKEMAGRVGDSTLPIGDRLAALSEVEALNKKYLSQNGKSVATQAVEANRTGMPINVDSLLNHYLGKK